MSMSKQFIRSDAELEAIKEKYKDPKAMDEAIDVIAEEWSKGNLAVARKPTEKQLQRMDEMRNAGRMPPEPYSIGRL